MSVRGRSTPRLAMSACVMFVLAGCGRSLERERIDALEARIAALESAANAPARTGAVEAPELGEQMLELQLRHARLWGAGEGEDWTLVLFQTAEIRETVDAIVKANPDHAALQPARLAEVMPAMVGPALAALRDSADHADRAAFERAYDELSAGCNACHAAAGHEFLRIGRPRTPTLDNLETRRR